MYIASNSQIRGSTASMMESFAARSYFGGASEASAARTGFRATPTPDELLDR
jgi:hypothetical protein